MLNKKRIVIFVGFLCCLFFMTTFAGAPAQSTIIATRQVTFVDGYNNSNISSQSIEVGTDAMIPNEPYHEGYVFIGWYLYDNQSIKVEDFTNILNDLKIVAKYALDANGNGINDEKEQRYTITFIDTFDDTVLSTQEVLVGMDALAPSVPLHEGYEFVEWGTSYTNVIGNATVNTVYKKINNSVNESPSVIEERYFTVTFINGENGEVLSVVNVLEGTNADVPRLPEYEGKVFTRWEGNYFNVDSDRTIIAIYADDKNNNGVPDEEEIRYNITFNAGEHGTIIMPDGTVILSGETGAIVSILPGTLFGDMVPTKPVINAYENYISVGFEPQLLNKDDEINSNLSFTAIYKEDLNNNGIPDDEELYLVTYDKTFEDAIGILPVDNNTYIEGEEFEISSETVLVKNNAVHVGWSLEMLPLLSKSNYEKYSSKIVTSGKMTLDGITVYAVFAEDANGDGKPDYTENYKVIYDKGSLGAKGDVPEDVKTYIKGQDYKVLSNVKSDGSEYLTLDGAVFIGWSEVQLPVLNSSNYDDNSSDIILASSVKQMPEGGITLYAVFAEDVDGDGLPDCIDNYRVIYDKGMATSGKVPVDNNKYLLGEEFEVEKVTDLKLEKAVFIGWTTLLDIPLLTKENYLSFENAIIMSGKMPEGGVTLYPVFAQDLDNDGKPDYKKELVTIDFESNLNGNTLTEFYGNV